MTPSLSSDRSNQNIRCTSSCTYRSMTLNNCWNNRCMSRCMSQNIHRCNCPRKNCYSSQNNSNHTFLMLNRCNHRNN